MAFVSCREKEIQIVGGKGEIKIQVGSEEGGMGLGMYELKARDLKDLIVERSIRMKKRRKGILIISIMEVMEMKMPIVM